MKKISIVRVDGWLRSTPLAVWGLLAAAAVWVLRFNPTDRVADPTGPCLWHAAFGIDGPTCGGTRMFYHLIHGDLLHAAQMHLPALIGLLYGGYTLVAWTASWLLGKQLPVWKPGRWTIIGYIAFFLIWVTVARNLPWTPFTWFYVPNLT